MLVPCLDSSTEQHLSLLLLQMLATLLIFRQFLQNVKEVLQPYLYEQNKLGVFTPQVMWELLQTIVVKYGRLALGPQKGVGHHRGLGLS